MDWYYASKNQRLGPVPQGQLEELADTGTITSQTLVWREGLAGWQTYGSLAVRSSAAVIPHTETGRCTECGRDFPKDDLLAYSGLLVCAACKPLFVQRVREGLAPGGAQLWRDRRNLVIAVGASFPDRCVKCNVAVDGARLKRQLQWHPPAVYLALVLNVLVYIVIAMVTRKQMAVQIGLCEEHRGKRRSAILTGWLLVFASVGVFALAVSFQNGWLALVGGLLLVGGMIYGVVRGRVVFARRINKEHAWVGGACPAFLDALPAWPGR